jgi:hypothetical protein
VTDPERRAPNHAAPPASTPDPPTQTAPTRSDEPRQRPWWQTRGARPATAALLAVIGVGGYFALNAARPNTSSPLSSRVLKQVPFLPRGAVPCNQPPTDDHVWFNAGARGTSVTSCGFVEQVRKEYTTRNPVPSSTVQMRVISTATVAIKWYDVSCVTTGSYVTCAGGAFAVIYLYHQ